jgi:hypothetical protein
MKCVSIECSQRTPNTGGSNFNPIKLHLTKAGKQVKTTYEVLLGRRPCVRIANTVSALTKNRKISLPSSSIDLASDDIRRTSAATPKRTRSVHWSLVLSARILVLQGQQRVLNRALSRRFAPWEQTATPFFYTMFCEVCLCQALMHPRKIRPSRIITESNKNSIIGKLNRG